MRKLPIYYHLTVLLLAGVFGEPAHADGGAPVRGLVRSGNGVAIEHAKVTAIATEAVVYSDHHGRFSIDGCALPCLLLVTHPRFEEQAVEAGGGDVEIAMAAKQAVFERIDVTATRGGGAFTPVSVASTVVRPEDRPAAPSTLTELVEGTAGVAENGQGGLFQVFSIRGVSRHRVLTLVSGVPIISERRAGVSTSFIDPLLMGSVDVVRGPSSTYYGSGALGGVVQVFPRSFDGLRLETGWNSFGDESFQHVGWGDPETGWSVGFARRHAGDDAGADGRVLNAHFTQVSASISKRWEADGIGYEILALPSLGRDLGKPNTDFPDRTTTYPQETHLLLKFSLSSPRIGNFYAFAHPNNLVTEVVDAGESLSVVRNESFDLGFDWQREWSLAGSGKGGVSGRYGVDYLGRRAVAADERIESLDSGAVTRARPLDGATQDEAAAYGTVSWGWGAATLQAGSRLTWQHQTNRGHESRSDTAWTGFLGLVQPLGGGVELTANLGTGLRFPNLSERFFTGTTGRGQFLGNPALDAESSLNFDLGIRWFGTKVFVGAQVFQLRIDDYIERIDLPDDTRTFVNLTSGTIRGFELEGFYQLHEDWLLSWSGHVLDGDDDSGGPLADISPDRLQAGIRYDRGRWQGQVQLQHRAHKDDPGSGEIEIPSAEILSASLSYRLQSGLTLTVRGRNLLDEEYLTSADDKTSVAPGRSVGLALSWSAP
ncbi:MAG: TonB-dependent receptor [Thermoanaerobaculia bacterium]